MKCCELRTISPNRTEIIQFVDHPLPTNQEPPKNNNECVIKVLTAQEESLQ